MGIFDFFRSNQSDIEWDSVKKGDTVYPENSISVFMAKTEEGKLATGWIDLAYLEYEYKSFCPYNLQFSVEIDENSDLDMGTVEDYLVNKLREGCIAHPVARIATDFGFTMDFYVDDAEFASEMLAKLYESPDKLVEFGCGFNEDRKWKELKRIAKQLS